MGASAGRDATPRALIPPPEVPVTRPEKLLWPDLEVTKRAYAEYLQAVADDMLPWLRDRPLTLIRAPDGVQGERYFQKSVSQYAPLWIRTVRISAPSAKRDVDYVVCNDRTTLAWLGNQATVEFHPAPVRRDRVDRPDLLAIDIDPPDGGFAAAVEVARVVLEVLDELGVSSGVKTTGGKGLHIVVPIERRVTQEELKLAASSLAALVAERRPGAVTEEFRKADRGGRVMLDPSRNGTGATIVAPYSPRARDAGTVSFPVVPDELDAISPTGFTLRTVPGLLDAAGPRRWRTLVGERNRLPAGLVDGRGKGAG